MPLASTGPEGGGGFERWPDASCWNRVNSAVSLELLRFNILFVVETANCFDCSLRMATSIAFVASVLLRHSAAAECCRIADIESTWSIPNSCTCRSSTSHRRFARSRAFFEMRFVWSSDRESLSTASLDRSLAS